MVREVEKTCFYAGFNGCGNEWCYFITRPFQYTYIYSLPFKIAHSEPYHSPKSENFSLRAAVQIRLLRPIRPPAVSHGKISFPDKLIYRALDGRHAAFVIRGDFLV